MTNLNTLALVLCCSTFTACQTLPTSTKLAGASSTQKPLQGITFADTGSSVFLPLPEVQSFLPKNTSAPSTRSLVDGTPLVNLTTLEKKGFQRTPASNAEDIILKKGRQQLSVHIGSKRVFINLSTQRLSAWQGDRLVLKTRISSGKNGRTPIGHFRAGPYKAKRHYSSLYHNAPMPWSVQVNGHIFIHGFSSVPNYPASHGCIRVPLTDGNPARFFYQWANRGTPIEISNHAPKNSSETTTL
ncbi:MAG: L,D-transpeptidase [Roseibacillus sp.]